MHIIVAVCLDDSYHELSILRSNIAIREGQLDYYTFLWFISTYYMRKKTDNYHKNYCILGNAGSVVIKSKNDWGHHGYHQKLTLEKAKWIFYQ